MAINPLISIITPSYNSEDYIEETIQSILNQNYPHIEHIIIDGGSTDKTISILEKYRNKIKWASEPDNGMYDAVNKGFNLAQGEIFSYINSDDLYFSNLIVEKIADVFLTNPSIDFIYGHCAFINVDGKNLYTYRAPPFIRKIALAYPRIIFHQPTCFWRKRVHIEFDGSFKHCGDSKFFRHLCNFANGKNINQTVAKFRVREDCISFLNRERMKKEDEKVFGSQEERFTALIYRLFDLFYIRTFLNLKANLTRLKLYIQKKPYL